MSAWIRMIPLEEAQGTLAEAYRGVTTPHGTVDNVMKAHSLRPHTMLGHVALYRSVLHNPDNTLPFGFLEMVASWVSTLNRCTYSFTHHWANARRLLGDKTRAAAILQAFEARELQRVFQGKELALLRYAGKLTTEVGAMAQADIDVLREAGCEDGEILEVNQVCAYFNYSNRLLNGLGVTTEGDVIGYYAED
jgi:uncharacterized peroxidase-related enzyme